MTGLDSDLKLHMKRRADCEIFICKSTLGKVKKSREFSLNGGDEPNYFCKTMGKMMLSKSVLVCFQGSNCLESRQKTT